MILNEFSQRTLKQGNQAAWYVHDDNLAKNWRLRDNSAGVCAATDGHRHGATSCTNTSLGIRRPMRCPRNWKDYNAQFWLAINDCRSSCLQAGAWVIYMDTVHFRRVYSILEALKSEYYPWFCPSEQNRKMSRFGNGISVDLINSIPSNLLATLPAAAPPPGVIPNFDHPPSRSNLLLGLTTAFLVLAVISYFIRMYTKIRILRKVTWDDCKSNVIASIAFKVS
jgi:hypothetical protein